MAKTPLDSTAVINRASDGLRRLWPLMDARPHDVAEAFRFLAQANPELVAWLADVCSKAASSASAIPTEER